MRQPGVAWVSHCGRVSREAPLVPDVGSLRGCACPFQSPRQGACVGLPWIVADNTVQPRSGLLRSRALPTERTLARVCREAGATVRLNAKLRDMNIDVPATDERAIEVLASGLELNHGAQLAVDITVRSAVTACGRARPNAAAVDGAVLEEARHQKEVKYAELCAGDRCRLVVVGIETGGRWSPEALSFVERLAASRACDAPPLLRFSSFLSWRKRWCRMLSVSCSRAFAGTLVSSADDQLEGTDGIVPELADLFSAE